VKALIIANVVMFLVTLALPDVARYLGLRPADVLEKFWWWQPVTYMFLHAGVFHILFNMLVLWMFGVELERLWGTRFFTRYYFITGVGAGLVMLAISVLPLGFERTYEVMTVGASGAMFGLLLAFGMYFPRREIYLYFLFPVQAKYFVMIVGAMALLATVADQGGGVAHAAHLGGLAVGYVYLKSGRVRFHPLAELKYRYLKWKINRVRKRFDVYSGGRTDDVDRRVH
jgi:membrane associated rhomboid family serine protease